MSPSMRTVTFSGSRLKLAPQAILLSAFILPFAFLSFGSISAFAGSSPLTPGRIMGWALITIVLAFFIWLELQTLRRLAQPDLLTVAPKGLSLISAGRRTSVPWAMLEEPKLGRLSGKSAARSIVVPIHGGGRIIILADEFASTAEDILKALQQGKMGHSIGEPQRSSQALYLNLAIPASTLVLGIVLAGLGAILAN